MPDPLHVEPAAGGHAAALCDAAAAELVDCAAQLGEDADAALRALLERHSGNLNEFAARFRAAEVAYGEADRGGADRYPS